MQRRIPPTSVALILYSILICCSCSRLAILPCQLCKIAITLTSILCHSSISNPAVVPAPAVVDLSDILVVYLIVELGNRSKLLISRSYIISRRDITLSSAVSVVDGNSIEDILTLRSSSLLKCLFVSTLYLERNLPQATAYVIAGACDQIVILLWSTSLNIVENLTLRVDQLDSSLGEIYVDRVHLNDDTLVLCDLRALDESYNRIRSFVCLVVTELRILADDTMEHHKRRWFSSVDVQTATGVSSEELNASQSTVELVDRSLVRSDGLNQLLVALGLCSSDLALELGNSVLQSSSGSALSLQLGNSLIGLVQIGLCCIGLLDVCLSVSDGLVQFISCSALGDGSLSVGEILLDSCDSVSVCSGSLAGSVGQLLSVLSYGSSVVSTGLSLSSGLDSLGSGLTSSLSSVLYGCNVSCVCFGLLLGSIGSSLCSSQLCLQCLNITLEGSLVDLLLEIVDVIVVVLARR